jgi:hypothetical protein
MLHALSLPATGSTEAHVRHDHEHQTERERTEEQQGVHDRSPPSGIVSPLS